MTLSKTLLIFRIVLLLVSISLPKLALGQPVTPHGLIERLNKIIIEVPVNEQEEVLEILLQDVVNYREENAEDAESWVVSAVVRSAYLRTQGLGALGQAKVARAEFETSIDLDQNLWSGYSLAFLGRLYFSVPGWPLSFGSDKKAEEYLQRALAISTTSMPNNLYYAEFLRQQKKYEEAERYISLAKAGSTPLPNSPYWQASLTQTIDETLLFIKER